MTQSHKSTVLNLANEVKSGPVRDREKAIDDLAQFLNPLNRTTNLSDLGDKGYHDIFESIFSFAISEKSSYCGTKKSSTRSAARLSKCAAAVRSAASRGVSKIGRKTLFAIIDHITQVLPGPNEGFVQPLIRDYVKALAELLSRPASVELLARREAAPWQNCVDFFIDMSLHILPDEASGGGAASLARASPAPTASMAWSTARSNSVLPNQGRGGAQVDGGPLRDSLEALNHLFSAVNAPVLHRHEDVASVVVKTLKAKHLSLGSRQTLCFSIINAIFSSIEADHLEAATDLVKEVLPLMGYWWRADRVSQDELIKGLRNEISRSIFLMHLHLEYLAVNLWDEDVRSNLENLGDALWQEYSKRNEPFRLQLHDLTFATSQLPENSMQLGLFGLRPHSLEAESYWLVVQNIANIEAILLRPKKEFTQELDQHPRKKKRTSHEPNAVRLKLKAEDVGVVRTALKVVPFLLAADGMLAEDVNDLLTDVISFVGNKNSITSSWALIACARSGLNSLTLCLPLLRCSGKLLNVLCVDQLELTYPSCVQWSKPCHDQEDVWRQIWQMAARSISLPATSRAACLLLHSIIEAGVFPYHSLSDDINNIVTSADTNGPGALSDTSIALMDRLFHERNARVPSASQSTSTDIIRWIFSKWNPADQAYAASHSAHVDTFDFVNLIRICCGTQPLPSNPLSTIPGTPLGESWRAQKEIAQFKKYLLLLGHNVDNTLPSPGTNKSNSDSGPPIANAGSFSRSKKVVLELLSSKVEELRELCDLWAKKTSDGGLQISFDRFQSLLSACILGTILIPYFKDLDHAQASSVESSLLEAAEKGVTAALDSVEPGAFTDLILRLMRPSIPNIRTTDLTNYYNQANSLLRLSLRIMDIMRQRQPAPNTDARADPMDLDDEFDSQSSSETITSTSAPLARQTLQLQLNPRTFYTETRSRLSLLSFLAQSGGRADLVPPKLIGHLLSLSDDELLSCQKVLTELFQSDLPVDSQDALRVIERIGDIVSNAEYQSCEVAQVTCLEVINSLSEIWLQDNQELAERVGDLYNYFIKVCLPSNILSPRTQMSLARLLFTLLKAKPEYGNNQRLESCRTSLLSILSTGCLRLKYFIYERIADIFDLYILMLHDEVFVDVLGSLPTDPGNVAGIAFRLLVLSRLACRWPTLLRRCTYHIFEIPGKIANSTPYAKRCLAEISDALRLKSPKDLFKLFSRQLMYTWLEHDPLQDIPYSIFGYDSLGELLTSIQAEAIGLTMMRGQDETSSEIARLTGLAETDLIKNNLATALAYTMVYTAAFSTSDKAKGEEQVKQKLGSQVFFESVYISFADIVALFFDIIDQEDAMEKVFTKFPELSVARKTLEAMKQIAHSPLKLPPNQQPMFRAKFVLNELRRLCQGTEYQFKDLWTPALVVFVARKLLGSVHPALGSLHACSVLRKLRIVISLAGDVALESYCLEMLLHSIRSFIVDIECADDALGITQYLLDRGRAYLTQVPSFLAGYALSTLASLRVFLESSQASTTQESLFSDTMRKARAFHGWLSQYLTEYSSPQFESESQRISFQSIVSAAANSGPSGTAEKGTFESELLLEILGDEATHSQLLNDSSRQLAFGLLCRNFAVPTRVTDDVVENDSDAICQAAAIWKSCKAQKLSDSYLAWAGRVVGRSFLASGSIPDGILRESRLSQYEKIAPEPDGSETGLLCLLQDLTTDPDFVVAGLAEATLRTVVSRAFADEEGTLIDACQQSLTEALFRTSQWDPYRPPPSELPARNASIRPPFQWTEDISSPTWLSNFSAHLAECIPDCVLLSVLPPVLTRVKGFSEKALPFIIHLVLLLQQENKETGAKTSISGSLKQWLSATEPGARENISLLINTILYLRTQEYPGESSIADRLRWLDVDFTAASSAASRCGMYKTALLFAELVASVAPESLRSTRRSSAVKEPNIDEALLTIFENIDDPDTYYGLAEEASLTSVLARLEFEKNGSKSLAFRGAQYDSHIRLGQAASNADGDALVKALGTLGFTGLSQSLLQTQQTSGSAQSSLESTFGTARRLENWNLPVPAASDHHAVVTYKAYQTMHREAGLPAARSAIYEGFSRTMQSLAERGQNAVTLRSRLGALAALSELDELLNVTDAAEQESIMLQFEERSQWMKSGLYDDVSHILSCRGTTISMLSQHPALASHGSLSVSSFRRMQVESMLLASGIYRYHQATQESLNISTALTDLIAPCEGLGIHVDAAVKIEVANSLWDHGEMSSSIRVLQGVDKELVLKKKKQTIPVSRSDLLSKIGHKISLARLLKPRDIQKEYLEPALKELKGSAGAGGKEAGLAFHQFALFCDQQLQDADGLEDLERLQSLRKAKRDEVDGLKALISSTRDSQLKAKYSHVLNKEKQWLDLDEQELARVVQTRSEFVRLSLENYLLSLAASEEHDNDALRFTALWLERSGEVAANEAVKHRLPSVPTHKFARLMSQLTSRLQHVDSPFQKLLMNLVYNICADHPYHGMYQIWSGTKAKAQEKDEMALLRLKATSQVAHMLATTEAVAGIWQAIDKTSKYYHILALEKNSKYKSGAKITLRDSTAATGLMNYLAKYKIPPPTAHIEVNPAKDYSGVPMVSRLEPTMTIASGVSAPKIITAIGTDGSKYKQLVKGGQDDLRQDAIMEQVFSAVSSLLKLHRATKQRNLGIRTYKVLPLTSSSGLIEFVRDTIPLHDFLMPAHERYHPSDLKGPECRKQILSVQNRSVEQRISTYKKVAAKFRPVMRYFFMEHFVDPDEWFARRLAYTRSTAAISMLGHVLGVGDRHGHNILLDTTTGEAVHIDLGIAFEAGRILPVPELVPFRLTRDIVDGMGITGTEGVFRRCCEFTLGALREEQYSIMTILDVLRYDPLHSWTVSPVRLARLQKARQDEDGSAEDASQGEERAKKAGGSAGGAGGGNEPSEGDRALEVVRKKLSKALSVTATVNELINQARDEGNLAVLYSGWAAYA